MKSSTPVWIALLAAFVAISAARSLAQSDSVETTEIIHGTVLNSVTHEPISRALVYSPDNRFATLTDDQGHFEFSFPRTDATQENATVPDRPNVLLARKMGFLNSEISPGTVAKDMTLSLMPEAHIVGRVSLPSSEPPDRIQVDIYRRMVQDGRAHWTFAGSSTTKSNGEFRFADLTAGIYKVLTRELLDRDPLTFDSRGQRYGYPPVYFPSATGFVSAAEIQLSSGETAQTNLALIRQPYYKVKIPVTNVQPGYGVTVNVFLAGHRGPGYSLGYNARDQAIEGSLPNGTYTVEASSFGASNASIAGSIEIGIRGSTVAGPTMVMNSTGSVNAVVKEEFSSDASTDTGGIGMGFVQSNGSSRRSGRSGPRHYLNVLLEPADDFSQQQTQSLVPLANSSDTLILEHAPPGHYWVRVITSRGFVASVRSGSTDLQQHPLEVGIGGTPSPIEITMRDDAGAISGVIEGITSSASATQDLSQGDTFTSGLAVAPRAPAHVYCIPMSDSDGTFTEVWVSPDGTFQSPPLAPGTYRVLAFEHPQREFEYRNSEVMRDYDSRGPIVRLDGGQKENVRLQLITE